MSGIKRVDPRRPYRLSPMGVRRIVLGETLGAPAMPLEGAPASAQRAKPVRTVVSPSSWHMAIAHTNRGRLDEHARQAIAAAAILSGPHTGVVAIILGPLEEPKAPLGADVVGVFPDHGIASFAPERDVALISALIATYQPLHIFLADTAEGSGDLGRRLAARHRATVASHVVEVGGGRVTVTWDASARLATADMPRFVLLAPGAVDATLPFDGAAADLSSFDAAIPTEAIRDLGLETSDPSSIALEEADFIVSAGNGVSNTATLKTLARDLGAAVGASRVAVDDGKFSRSQQIGATGKTVSATTYVAVGISGAVQHLQGIKACRHVIAINRDAGAPIIGRADFSVIGDAERIMQELIELMATVRHNSNPAEAAE